MKLSIIIPVYNSQKYINECLDSILSYTNNDYEIIIINDGSTDESVSLCEKYVSEFKNIKLYSIENHGVSYARNYGIKKAIGDYIMFVDSDDCLIPGWQDIVLKENTEEIIYINKYIEKTDKKEYLLKCILGLNNNEETLAGPYSKLFKSSFLKNNNIFFRKDIINGEDMLFNIEALLKSEKIKIVNDSFYLYRINPNSITNKFNEKIIESDLNFQNALQEILIDYPEFNNYVNNKKVNGIITICKFISYLNKYSAAKKYFEQIYISSYTDVVNYKSAELNKKQKYIYKLFLKKKFFTLFYLYKILNYSKFKKINKETYFINI